MEFFDFAFWQNFVSNSFATLLGVILGIPVAFFLDRKINQRQEQQEIAKQQEILSQQKAQLLQTLKESLQKNLTLVEQMESELKPETVIFYNVDTQLLEGTSSLKYEIIDDLDLNRQLDSIRYELLHLHRKVELQLEIEFSAYKAMGNYTAKRKQLVETIIAHLPRIKEEIKNALAVM
jgi:hypothetical protein